jgi:hypothetical protein
MYYVGVTFQVVRSYLSLHKPLLASRSASLPCATSQVGKIEDAEQLALAAVDGGVDSTEEIVALFGGQQDTAWRLLRTLATEASKAEGGSRRGSIEVRVLHALC